MKYKRRKNSSEKYIRCDFEKNHTLRRKSFIKRSVISFLAVISIFAITRSNFINKEYIREIISSDSPYGGKKLTSFVQSTAKEVSAVYTNQFKTKKPDSVYAKKNETISAEKEKPFKVKNPCAGRISSDYGNRVHPISKTVKFHEGIDIAATEGSPVMACFKGVVQSVGYDVSSGNYVILDHENGYSSFYAHMKEVSSKIGDHVNSGDIIGSVGSTGASTGAHLHFEIRSDGSHVNPREYISFEQ